VGSIRFETAAPEAGVAQGEAPSEALELPPLPEWGGVAGQLNPRPALSEGLRAWTPESPRVAEPVVVRPANPGAVPAVSIANSQSSREATGKSPEPPVQSARNLAWQPTATAPTSPAEIADRNSLPEPENRSDAALEASRFNVSQTTVAERNESQPDSSQQRRSAGADKRSTGLGTPDAGEGMSMAYSAIQSEIAGSGETRTPGRAEMSRTGSALEVASDLPQPQIPQEPSVKRFDPAPSEAGSTATPSAPRLDRFAELISTEANILRQFRPGILSAVVRPDAHSELRIELRLNRGQAEVRASLERGDIEAFKAGWPELQSNLLAQGIALLPLNEAPLGGSAGKTPEPSQFGAADSRSGGRSGHRDNPQDLRGDAASFGFPGESSRSTSAKSATPAGAVGGTRHLLESWA
jgi:hypothetical protein